MQEQPELVQEWSRGLLVGMAGGLGVGQKAMLGCGVHSEKSQGVCTRASQCNVVEWMGTSWVTLTRSICIDQVYVMGERVHARC